ncbi:MAG: sulfatase family protein [Planctomycetota bacterium]|jgi:arylsulfatase A-like enzyme
MKPNILLITGDHARHDAVACNLTDKLTRQLASVVKTPNLDGLASDGVTFQNSHSSNPICVPGRASITTGNYSHKCTTSKNNGGRIHDDQIKIAEHFKGHGYDTCAIGKLHYVPYSKPGEPRLLHGFDYAELCEEGRIIGMFGDNKEEVKGMEDYHDYLHSVGWGGYERAHGTGNNDIHPSPTPLPAEHHEESWVAARSIEWLENNWDKDSGKPFFMWSSFTKPHPPYDPPAEYFNMYDPREVPLPLADGDDAILEGRNPYILYENTWYGWDRMSKSGYQNTRAVYCGLMTFHDAMIGRIIEHLKEKGLYENTIIIYTADHGDLLGDFGRFFKCNMYDGSVKVPLIIHAPMLEKEDSGKREQLVGLQDILPTLCAITGTTPDNYEFDGVDLSAAYKSSKNDTRDFYVSHSMSAPRQTYMIRTKEWKYIYTEIEGTEELYKDDGKDYELNNLIADPQYKDIAADFKKQLTQWCIDNNDEEMIKDGELVVTELTEEVTAVGMKPNILGWRKF